MGWWVVETLKRLHRLRVPPRRRTRALETCKRTSTIYVGIYHTFSLIHMIFGEECLQRARAYDNRLTLAYIVLDFIMSNVWICYKYGMICDTQFFSKQLSALTATWWSCLHRVIRSFYLT